MFANWYGFINTFFGKVFDVAVMILSYPVFNIPIYGYILSFYIISFVVGFLVHGQVSLGGVANIVGGVSRSAETAKAERVAKERYRSSNIGFKG